MRSSYFGIWLSLVALMAACAPATPRATESGMASAPTAAAPKRVTLAVVTEPTALRTQLSRSSIGSLPGSQELEQLVNAGLAIQDDAGKMRPELAEEVPSVENGGWKLFPDGRMETTWRIRPNARWQDGVPFTADDIVFTAAVARDRDLSLFRDLAFG